MIKSSEGVDKGKLACKINVYYRGLKIKFKYCMKEYSYKFTNSHELRSFPIFYL